MTSSTTATIPMIRIAKVLLLWAWTMAGVSEASSTTQNKMVDRPYQLWKPQEIHDTLHRWSEQYSQFCRVSTSQDEFQLPRAGSANDCPYENDHNGCNNYILEIMDFTLHPPHSASSQMIPTVLWSGTLHGNERVGPTAVMEAAQLLLQAADCEAKPNIQLKKINGNDKTWKQELQNAMTCRADLQAQGIGDAERQWLARLVTTRRIMVVPTANALGYYQNKRTEGSIDPNRDFPFDVQDPKLCMQTIAGRTLNEIFRQHLIQLSLTFHGGMEVIGYEWGAPTYLDHSSPDHVAQDQIARSYSEYGGNFPSSTAYQYGTMNDLVYYVRGGFEDWAYAASWDPDRVVSCEPTTFGGYSKDKTIYDTSTLRVFNMLVETSNRKEPRPNTLGSSYNVLNAAHANTNGHVSRNIRLALLAAEMVEPYVAIRAVNNVVLTNDIVPLQSRTRSDCQSSMTHTIMIPTTTTTTTTTIEWTVGGSLTIDDTSLYIGTWDKVESLDCQTELHADSVVGIQTQLEKITTMTSPTQGSTRFSSSGPVPQPSDASPLLDKKQSKVYKDPIFSATIDTSTYQKGDELVLLAFAKVDQNWKTQPTNIAPHVLPTSHIVNARTDSHWTHENSETGERIQGRTEWMSLPVTIIIGGSGDDDDDDANNDNGNTEMDPRIQTIHSYELSNRFGTLDGTPSFHNGSGENNNNSNSSSNNKENNNNGIPSLDYHHYLGIVGAFLVAVTMTLAFVKYKRRVTHQRLVNELYEEENEFQYGHGAYADDDEEFVIEDPHNSVELGDMRRNFSQIT